MQRTLFFCLGAGSGNFDDVVFRKRDSSEFRPAIANDVWIAAKKKFGNLGGGVAKRRQTCGESGRRHSIVGGGGIERSNERSESVIDGVEEGFRKIFWNRRLRRLEWIGELNSARSGQDYGRIVSRHAGEIIEKDDVGSSAEAFSEGVGQCEQLFLDGRVNGVDGRFGAFGEGAVPMGQVVEVVVPYEDGDAHGSVGASGGVKQVRSQCWSGSSQGGEASPDVEAGRFLGVARRDVSWMIAHSSAFLGNLRSKVRAEARKRYGKSTVRPCGFP